MIRRLAFCIGATFLTLDAMAQSLPPAEAFGSLEAVDYSRINPSGQLVAWAANDGKSTQVTVIDLANHKTLRSFAVEDGFKVRRLEWATDSTLLFSMSTTLSSSNRRLPSRFELQRWVAANVTNGNVQLLLTKGNERVLSGSQLVSRQGSQPGTIIMASTDWSAVEKASEIGTRLGGGRRNSGWQYNLYEVEIGGKSRLLERGTPYTDDWLVDAKGQPFARGDWNPELGKYSVLVKEGSGWRRVYESVKSAMDLEGVSADGTAVYAVGSNGEPRSALWSIPVDGSAPKKLIEDPVLEVEEAEHDPLTDLVVGARLGGMQRPSRWIDPAVEKRYAALGRTFAGRTSEVVSRSSDNKRIVVRVSSGTQPPIYYLVDYGAKTADIVGEAYPALANMTPGTQRAYAYKSRDGVDLNAYLTIPPGAAEKDLPLVVMPHGGPEARDDPDFDWWTQFLSSRGYAVLRPEFRGSTGFGREHVLAGRGQWGLRMQDDITDAVKSVIADGIADKKRVCIVGASYGGYAALAGVTYTPELYACGVSVAGVADLGEMLAYGEKMSGDDSDSTLYWRDSIGTRDDPRVGQKSPARHARNIRAPVLLIHGSNDSVVPFAQSQMMDNALSEAGVPHQLISLDSEDHWLSSGATRIRLLSEIEKFLAANLATKH
jgi:dipeptidyl aminopeptidase/acylaminoacyl peptidase